MSIRISPDFARRRVVSAIKVASALLLAGITGVSAQSPERRTWPDYGGGPDNSKYSSLTQIDKTNVTKLSVAWQYPYGETLFNPVAINGMIYVKGRSSSLIALDAATGKEVWIHEGLQGANPRGVNYWQSKDGKDRRLIFTLGDYLQEIDAASGKTIRDFGANGAVDLREGLGREASSIGRVQSNTPGKVFDNLIILGSAPGEAYFSAPGDLRAYDIVTGKAVWQFHTIPRPGEYGYDTWPKDAWKYSGAANTWGEITVDPVRGIAYFPTGSATFDFYGGDRVGMDLFGDCLVALDARTGKRLWHFQNVHHDLWDYDNTAAPQLTSIKKDGKLLDVVAMAGKTGFLYVFNRVTGEPIWPIPEKPVPSTSEIPGESVWPTQPFPSAPPAFARQKFTVDDLNTVLLSPQEQETFRKRIAAARNEGLFTPIGFQEAIHMPGNNGGANFGNTSAHPTDGTVYVLSYDIPAIMRLLKPDEARGRRGGGGGGAAPSPGLMVYQRDCQTCHAAGLVGTPKGTALTGVTTRLSNEQIKSLVSVGKGDMPAFPHITPQELDAVIAYLAAPDAAGRAGGFGARGRGAAAGPALPPGPVVETGPAVTRPGGGGRGGGGAQAYPDGVDHPAERYTMDGYGLYEEIVKPPNMVITSYDLNKGTIRWQVPLGDDPRYVAKGLTGTGTAQDLKLGMIPTASGLVFVTGGDDRIRALDAATGQQLWVMQMGAATRGIPAMYDVNGRQFLVVTASGAGIGSNSRPRDNEPHGIVAFALPAAAR